LKKNENGIVWYEGIWKNGNWLYGEWKNGIMFMSKVTKKRKKCKDILEICKIVDFRQKN